MAIQRTKVYVFEDSSPISGMIEVEILPYAKRLRLLSQMNLKIDKETNKVSTDESGALERIAASIEMLKDHVKKMDCEIKETKEKLDFDDLCLLAEAQEILIKAGTDLVQGASLGKS